MIIHRIKQLVFTLPILLGVAFAFATPLDVSKAKETIPPNIVTTSNKPMVMLATSKDHTLFGPIYTDFEDIDDDGVIDTTFKPTFKYYGYFDATKCYKYNIITAAANERFEPEEMAILTGGRYTCSSAKKLWSGNFMNWATMTRLDVVRKMLYGGKRKVDTPNASDSNSLTILERANLSKDSHSFVKYYRGDDIRDYTPYTKSDLTKTTGSNKDIYAGLSICSRSNQMGPGGDPSMRMAKGNYRLWATVEKEACAWGSGGFGKKLSRYYKAATADVSKNDMGIAHEVDLPNETNDAAKYTDGPNSYMLMRVQVCKPSLLGEERCQPFPSNSTTNFKPYGIFQEFGLSATSSAAARAEFGVITGSYDKNLTAGALRKNMGDFADEINLNTGVFCHNTESQCSANLPDGRETGQGAIKSLDAVLLYGRNGNDYDGSYVQLPGEMTDGSLPAWGNPVGEMVVQALRYYAGKPTPDSSIANTRNTTSNPNDANTGLPTKFPTDPLSNASATRKSGYGNAICRPMYTLALSSSALSFDGQADSAFGDLPNRAKGGLSSYTDAIGAAEGINGTVRSVGSVSGGFGETCSGKVISTLSGVSGICPEAPAVGGTYQVAGAALYANTSQIRTIASPPSDLKFTQNALKVKTLAASLSGGAARVEILIPGSNPKKYVYITPESLWNANGKKMPGALLTFASISSGPKFGTFVVTWNDSLFGGDYEMDIAGFLRYDVVDDSTSPSGYSVKITTDILNVGAGYTGTHGYSVLGTGTATDKRYLTHRSDVGGGDVPLRGAEGYVCENVAAGADGNACNVSSNYVTVRDKDFPITKTFQMIGVNNALIQDPLWYAAKYGSFSSSAKNADGTFENVLLPPDQSSWDSQKSDGTGGSDGVPDGYFLARRPDILEAQLRKALDSLAKVSNAAPVASSSALQIGSLKYNVNFDSTANTGVLAAYKLKADGEFESNYVWEAGALLRTSASGNGGNNRSIITNSGKAGVKFRWDSLPSEYQTQMTSSSTNKLTAAHAKIAVGYIRGDQSLESADGLRQRGTTLLGPIVNSTPWLQDTVGAGFSGNNSLTYRSFLKEKATQQKLLWVGANDGMLHAFNATTGAEVFAYVPGTLANRLAEIPLQRGGTSRTKINGINYTSNASEVAPLDTTVWPYADGNPYTADVQVGTDWKTYVFSSLGRGGKAVFALDATKTAGLAEDNASNIFKWQFTSDDDADLGYITSSITRHPVTGQAMPIVKMNNGEYAMLLANGYKSVAGKAVLFILYMKGPDAGSWTGRYKKIVAAMGPDNGLSVPRWEDLDLNGTADIAYAGDLKGNLWKFDLSSEKEADWGIAFKSGSNNVPLFKATVDGLPGSTPLPISTTPEVYYMGSGGILVTFGTGDAFDSVAYPTPSIIYRMYGIIDKASASRTLPMGVANLVKRTYIRDSNGLVTLDKTAAQVPDGTAKTGWYFNFPSASEVVLSTPQLKAGILFFRSTRPNNAIDQCSTRPFISQYAIDPISGTAERKNLGSKGPDIPITALDVRGDSSPIQSTITSSLKPPPPKPGNTSTPPPECVSGQFCAPKECRPNERRFQSIDGFGTCAMINPRLQWREIPGLRTDQ